MNVSTGHDDNEDLHPRRRVDFILLTWFLQDRSNGNRILPCSSFLILVSLRVNGIDRAPGLEPLNAWALDNNNNISIYTLL